jgi:hypothetical protein
LKGALPKISETKIVAALVLMLTRATHHNEKKQKMKEESFEKGLKK